MVHSRVGYKSETTEGNRLKVNYAEGRKWHKWGPYLSERQWGTVREDYSENGDAWNYLSYDQSRSKVYRWGEDGIGGISDIYCKLCFSMAFWNGNDDHLKERLFGLAGPEGNHGEDVKELYYYLDNTPTHSYMKYLYKYPHKAFPYEKLRRKNRELGKQDAEFELLDTGILDDNAYFDINIEYAKVDEFDIQIKITAHNRGRESAELYMLPTLLFRNEWSFKKVVKPIIKKVRSKKICGVRATHPTMDEYFMYFDEPEKWLFTENETNFKYLYNVTNKSPYVKDLFHKAVTSDDYRLTDKRSSGTKFAPLYKRDIPAGGSTEIRLRLSRSNYGDQALEKKSFEKIFRDRISEADEFYDDYAQGLEEDEKNIQRQAFAGMLWTKQYYNYEVDAWLNGDPRQPVPAGSRKYGRNNTWTSLNNEDIISMPDKWEYPWYAAWDLAFHCITLSMLDMEFAKHQLVLLLREWYMSDKGQIPAYEWSFSDVNPPVHAWAALHVYEMEKKLTGHGDVHFLKRVFNKLVINFTWWVNRKDRSENNVFEGGFLGLDNIGVFDRSADLPGGGYLEQADGTAWMAMYCLNMLQISLEIAKEDSSYEDMATKFFEHFVLIASALNTLSAGGTGSWDENDGFFYDILNMPDGRRIPLKTRSLVGLITIFPAMVIDKETMDKLPGFTDRLKWFRNYRQDKNKYLVIEDYKENESLLLSLVPKNRLNSLMSALLDEDEFLSPYGMRSLSKLYTQPYVISIDGEVFSVAYDPAESTSFLFGGNSNWRGPVWIPMNFLMINSLKEYHKFYGDDQKYECPTGSGNFMTMEEISDELSRRLIKLFAKDSSGNRAVNKPYHDYYQDPHFKDLVLFFEYFHGDNGRGVGASHQTGWTGAVAQLIVEMKNK